MIFSCLEEIISLKLRVSVDAVRLSRRSVVDRIENFHGRCSAMLWNTFWAETGAQLRL